MFFTFLCCILLTARAGFSSFSFSFILSTTNPKYDVSFYKQQNSVLKKKKKTKKERK